MNALMDRSRILIIEDESLVALNLKEQLEALGYEIVGHAASGEEAVASAWENRPDLALVDIRLQGRIDGIETVARLRDQLDIAVVFLTAHSDEDTLQRAKQVAPSGYLIKPVDRRGLRVMVEIALAGRPRRQQEEELPLDMEAALTQTEERVIRRALERTDNDVAAAACLLGIHPKRIYRVLEHFESPIGLESHPVCCGER